MPVAVAPNTTEHPPPPRRPAVLAAGRVCVDYPGVRALDCVSLGFGLGEIHAIVGENGAGKSTLMKVLSGFSRPTSGGLILDDRPVSFARPADALRAGIAMVHQELNLVPTLTIAENILLGREPRRGVLKLAVDGRRQRREAERLLALLGAELDVRREARHLSVAEAQFVEIARCLASEARILIFDEPTAVLGERETSRLLALLRRLRDEGRAILFISHHLDEVIDVADRASVLRDGVLVAEFARQRRGAHPIDQPHHAPRAPHSAPLIAVGDPRERPITEGTLAESMVGRPLGSIFPPRRPTCQRPGDASAPRVPRLVLRALRPADAPFADASSSNAGVELEIAAGEVVGMAGLIGSGRTELAESVVGIRRALGAVILEGQPRRFRTLREAMGAGVVYLSEDRKGRGLHLSLSSIANTTLPSLNSFSQLGGLRIDHRAERAVTRCWIDELAIRCARPSEPIATLSGGNQQKFALARWLHTRPSVLLLDEPTRGVDVGAKEEIYRLIAQLAAEGLACLVISSELPELIGLCDRVVVMREGRLVGELSREQLDWHDAEVRLVRLASGLSAAAESA